MELLCPRAYQGRSCAGRRLGGRIAMVRVPWDVPRWDAGSSEGISTVVTVDVILGPTACLATDMLDHMSFAVAFQEQVPLGGIVCISLIDFQALEEHDILELRPTARSS